MLRTTTILALTLAVAAQAAPGRAESPQVEELIDQGIEQRRAGRAEDALMLFKKAHALEPTPRTLAQVGLAESAYAGVLAKDLKSQQASAQWLAAEEHLQAALRDEKHSWVSQNKLALQTALTNVRQHIGELVVTGTPRGALVYVNNEGQGALPLPAAVRVGEGEANVQVRAPGYQPGLRTVSIRPRTTTTVDLKLELADNATALRAPARTTIAGSPGLRPGWWTTRRMVATGLVTAGLATAVGGTFWVVGDSECNPRPGDVCNRRPPSRTPGWLMLAAGGAAAAAGGLVFFLGSESKSPVAVSLSPSGFAVGGRL